MTRRQCNQLSPLAVEERIIREEECTDLLLDEGCEGSIELVYRAGSHDINAKSQGGRSLLRVFGMGLSFCKIRIHEHANSRGLGQQLVQYPKTLCPQFGLEKIHTSDVAARSV